MDKLAIDVKKRVEVGGSAGGRKKRRKGKEKIDSCL